MSDADALKDALALFVQSMEETKLSYQDATRESFDQRVAYPLVADTRAAIDAIEYLEGQIQDCRRFGLSEG